jgi:hypothetical protein
MHIRITAWMAENEDVTFTLCFLYYSFDKISFCFVCLFVPKTQCATFHVIIIMTLLETKQIQKLPTLSFLNMVRMSYENLSWKQLMWQKWWCRRLNCYWKVSLLLVLPFCARPPTLNLGLAGKNVRKRQLEIEVTWQFWRNTYLCTSEFRVESIWC